MDQPGESRRRRVGTGRFFAVLLAAGAAWAWGGLAGCNIVAPVALVLSPPPSTDAVFELDGARTHAIFIDDLRSRVPKRSLRDLIGTTAEGAMLEEEVLPNNQLIASAAFARAASDDQFSRKLSVVDLGRRVGADVVIYVSMESFSLTRDGTTLVPEALASVKVLDTTNNKRLFPPGDGGYPLRVQVASEKGEVPRDLAGRGAAEQALARRVGLALAQMFYSHWSAQGAAGAR